MVGWWWDGSNTEDLVLYTVHVFIDCFLPVFFVSGVECILWSQNMRAYSSNGTLEYNGGMCLPWLVIALSCRRPRLTHRLETMFMSAIKLWMST